MIGSCIIDGVDLHSLGIFIERGGSDDFLSFPDRRLPDFNDWPDEDGLDVDLSDVTFDAKRVLVNYVITAADYVSFKQRLNSFESMHFSPGLRQVYVKEFRRTFTLRFVGFPAYKHKGGMYNPRKKIGRLTAEYSMDDPLQQFTSPVGDPMLTRPVTHVQLNQVDLASFGIIVRDVYSSALRPPSAKKILERKVRHVNGVLADEVARHKRAAREIIIECTMLAHTITLFWAYYTALFNAVSSPLIRLDSPHGKTIACFYKKMANFKKESSFSRGVRVSFSLVLQEISVMDAVRLLATSTGMIIITQDGYAINLTY